MVTCNHECFTRKGSGASRAAPCAGTATAPALDTTCGVGGVCRGGGTAVPPCVAKRSCRSRPGILGRHHARLAVRSVSRGDIWTVAGGSGYTLKPRPAVIVQDDRFSSLNSVALCPLTTDPLDLSIFRIFLVPTERNGLLEESRIMVDKIAAVPRARLGQRIGRLSSAEVVALNRALVVFLGIAAPVRRR